MSDLTKQEESSPITVGYNKHFSPSGPPTASQFDIADHSRPSHNYIVTPPVLPLHLSDNLSNLVIIPGGYWKLSLGTIENSVSRPKFEGISTLGVYFAISREKKKGKRNSSKPKRHRARSISGWTLERRIHRKVLPSLKKILIPSEIFDNSSKNWFVSPTKCCFHLLQISNPLILPL